MRYYVKDFIKKNVIKKIGLFSDTRISNALVAQKQVDFVNTNLSSKSHAT